MKTAIANTYGKTRRKNKGDAAKPQPLILGKSRLGECRLPECLGKKKCNNEQS
ncbi:hypothetical protein [Vibrio parahaemolyticus]|uniref:hypothetical protein n=1 Tax=Vibrio parahaemolyticus TaxID=670 RepID=UPI00177BBB99|nr:hypothetical protein [Vibrio parahaemolyticus]MBD6945044.1 hypothetical protein [Vibrio parahaemolyticus]MBD6978941.1 hypothetical protein [Vibrio parahaemolyticus]MBD6990946.1 hypothetical protein [Vibrio parahaemolyticus]WOZ62907.1 hypothetical protein RHS38_26180 [Vibrio parahaemolyticus]